MQFVVAGGRLGRGVSVEVRAATRTRQPQTNTFLAAFHRLPGDSHANMFDIRKYQPRAPFISPPQTWCKQSL